MWRLDSGTDALHTRPIRLRSRYQLAASSVFHLADQRPGKDSMDLQHFHSTVSNGLNDRATYKTVGVCLQTY